MRKIFGVATLLATAAWLVFGAPGESTPSPSDFLPVTVEIEALSEQGLPVEDLFVSAVNHELGLTTRCCVNTDEQGLASLEVMPGTWTFFGLSSNDEGTGFYLISPGETIGAEPGQVVTLQATRTVSITVETDLVNWEQSLVHVYAMTNPLATSVHQIPVASKLRGNHLNLSTNSDLLGRVIVFVETYLSPLLGEAECIFFVDDIDGTNGEVLISIDETNTAQLRAEAYGPSGGYATTGVLGVGSPEMSWGDTVRGGGCGTFSDPTPTMWVSPGEYFLLQETRMNAAFGEPWYRMDISDQTLEVSAGDSLVFRSGGPLSSPLVRTTPRGAEGFPPSTQILGLFQDSFGNFVKAIWEDSHVLWPEVVVFHGSSVSQPFYEPYGFGATGLEEEFDRDESPTYLIEWDLGPWGSGNSTGDLFGQDERRMDYHETPLQLSQVPRFETQFRQSQVEEYEDLFSAMQSALGVPTDFKVGIISNIQFYGFQDEVQHGYKLELPIELDSSFGYPAKVSGGRENFYTSHEAGHGRTLTPPARFGAVWSLGEAYASLIGYKAASLLFGGAPYLRHGLGRHDFFLRHLHGEPKSEPPYEDRSDIELMQFITNYIDAFYGWDPHKRMILEWANSFLPIRTELGESGYSDIEQFAIVYSWLCADDLGELFEAADLGVDTNRVTDGLAELYSYLAAIPGSELGLGENVVRAPQTSVAVELRSPPTAGLTSIQFELVYDPDHLQLEAVYRRDLSDLASWDITTNPVQLGTLQVSLSGATPIHSLGSIAQFNFSINPGTAGALPVEISQVVLNGEADSSATGTIQTGLIPLIGPFPVLPPAPVNAPYAANLWAIGGQPPYTWEVVEDALPLGLSISESSGEISGEASQSGEFLFRVRVRDSIGEDSHRWFSVLVGGATQVLTVNRLGTGGGRVTSSPAGINCGSDCNETYAEDTVVTLTAIPDEGSVFAGWGGNTDCLDGVLTMNGDLLCAALFDLEPIQNFSLSIAKEGTGGGRVTSSPAGINCGSDCNETYAENTVVTLTAIPDEGSVFAGWGGNTDCLDGVLTMNGDLSCSATFDSEACSLNVATAGSGAGIVTSSPPGIDCGSDCQEVFVCGAGVSLVASPSTGSLFLGWSGAADCADGEITMTLPMTCNARFETEEIFTDGFDSGVTSAWSDTISPCPISLNVLFEGASINACDVWVNGAVMTDPGCASITRIHWQWDDGTENDSWFPATHTYVANGTYSVTATAFDADGISASEMGTLQLDTCPTP